MIKAKIGDKVLLKDFSELPSIIQAGLNYDYYKQIEGQIRTVCNVIETEFGDVNNLGSIYEFEEDEDLNLNDDEKIYFLERISKELGITNNTKFTKQRHFSEIYIECILSDENIIIQ